MRGIVSIGRTAERSFGENYTKKYNTLGAAAPNLTATFQLS